MNTEINYFFEKAASGVLATLDIEGAPYCVPVHFVYVNEKIYIHSKKTGEKITNISRDPRVCFTAYRMDELLINADIKSPCTVNTKYQSIVVKGRANLIEDITAKRGILKKIVEKYTPELTGLTIPETAVLQTAVIEITPVSCTEKYYPKKD